MRAHAGVLEAAKAYVALLGAIAVGLVAEYGPSPWFVVPVIVATAFATWRVPNADPVTDVEGRHEAAPPTG